MKKAWAEELAKARQKLDEEFEPYHRRMVMLLAENPGLSAEERTEEIIDGLRNTSLCGSLRQARCGSLAAVVEGVRRLGRYFPAMVRSQQGGRAGASGGRR